MSIEILQGNLLESSEDAIVLPIDGAAKGMEGHLARLFALKYPDVWEELEYEIKYPIHLGDAKAFPIDNYLGCQNKVVVLVSTLHHIETLTNEEKRHVVKNALYRATGLAINNHVQSIASAILSGGWRLDIIDSIVTMIEVYAGLTRTNVNYPVLRIYILNSKEFEKVEKYLSTNKEFKKIENGKYRCL